MGPTAHSIRLISCSYSLRCRSICSGLNVSFLASKRGVRLALPLEFCISGAQWKKGTPRSGS